MPRTYEMSWEKNSKRWVKMVRGTRYRVSCDELRLPPSQQNKEASYPRAKQWLDAQLGITEQEERTNHPKAELLDALEARLGIASAVGDTDDVKLLQERLSQAKRLKTVIEELPLEPSTQAMLNTIESAFGIKLPVDDLPADLVDSVFNPQETIRNERAKQLNKVAESKQLGKVVEDYLRIKMKEVKAGTRSLIGWNRIKERIAKSVEFFTPLVSVESINAQQIEAYHEFITDQKWSKPYQRDFLVAFKAFMEWIYSTERIDKLPRNLNSLKVQVDEPKKVVFTTDEIKSICGSASEQLKAFFLICLNTGFTQMDIATLEQDMVKNFADCVESGDLNANDLKRLVKAKFSKDTLCIVRKRSKAKNYDNVSSTVFPLWDSTAELLMKFRSADSKLVFTRNGKPWIVQEFLPDGRWKDSDNIRWLWKTWARSNKFSGKSFKTCRKTVATMLETSPEHRHVGDLVLQHSPNTIAKKHYQDPKAMAVDVCLAIRWLGNQFGVA